MADYLARMLLKTHESQYTLRPRLASRFEAPAEQVSIPEENVPATVTSSPAAATTAHAGAEPALQQQTGIDSPTVRHATPVEQRGTPALDMSAERSADLQRTDSAFREHREPSEAVTRAPALPEPVPHNVTPQQSLRFEEQAGFTQPQTSINAFDEFVPPVKTGDTSRDSEESVITRIESVTMPAPEAQVVPRSVDTGELHPPRENVRVVPLEPFANALASAPADPPLIEINIERIELGETPRRPAPTPARTRPQPTLSLQQYLANRGRRCE